MAFVCDDLAEYSDTRGFCFENPRDYMPGELITDYDGLINYLNNMDALNENWSERYAAIQKEFNPFCDSNASERVCRQLWG
jgi:CDP-glycerol glycerophosphotransferase (TagB/SpsB family)